MITKIVFLFPIIHLLLLLIKVNVLSLRAEIYGISNKICIYSHLQSNTTYIALNYLTYQIKFVLTAFCTEPPSYIK